jgi:hypothetical protein
MEFYRLLATHLAHELPKVCAAGYDRRYSAAGGKYVKVFYPLVAGSVQIIVLQPSYSQVSNVVRVMNLVFARMISIKNGSNLSTPC